MLALPFVFAIFIVNFEAGLIVYWITTNVWTIGQQLLVQKLYPKPAPREPSDDDAKPPRAGNRRPPTAAPRSAGKPGDGKARRRPPRPRAATATARRASRRRTAQEEEALRAQALRRARSGCLRSRSRRTWWPKRGASVGEAKWAAMKELEPRFPGVTADCVTFEVLEGADDGPVRVRAEVDPDAWRAAADELPDEPAERVRALVSRAVHSLGLEATIDVDETDEEIRATVNGEDLGLLIGKHGATIDALQHIVYAGRVPRRRGTQAGDRRRGRLPRAPGAALQRMADRAVADALQLRTARSSSSRCARPSGRSCTTT